MGHFWHPAPRVFPAGPNDSMTNWCTCSVMSLVPSLWCLHPSQQDLFTPPWLRLLFSPRFLRPASLTSSSPGSFSNNMLSTYDRVPHICSPLLHSASLSICWEWECSYLCAHAEGIYSLPCMAGRGQSSVHPFWPSSSATYLRWGLAWGRCLLCRRKCLHVEFWKAFGQSAM